MRAVASSLLAESPIGNRIWKMLLMGPKPRSAHFYIVYAPDFGE